MKSEQFSRIIKSNKLFWKINNKHDDVNGYLLYEAFYSEQTYLYGISKTALTLAKILNLKPLVIRGMNAGKDEKSLICSMNQNVTGSKASYLYSFVLNSLEILNILGRLTNKQLLLELNISGCQVGEYIYDHLLRGLGIPEIEEITFRVKLKILIEIGYFFFFKGIIESNSIKMIVLGDNVYRYGMLFQLSKINNIQCIAPINLNAYSLSIYKNQTQFEFHYRKPDIRILENLDIHVVNDHLTEYFKKRFSALLEQHDVLKAFSSNKKVYSRAELIDKYALDSDKPIVVVMAHIFCDAPHGYPGTLYDDYYEWMKQTIKCLKENNNINFLVKEHPSASLYNEEGLLKSLLMKFDCSKYLLDESVHTLSVINESDTVITCGGTIGLEFLYKGKQVVLAARPPYSGYGLTVEPKTRSEYEELLKNTLTDMGTHSNEQRELTNKIIYYDFVMLDNYFEELEIGGQRYYMGKDFDYNKFYECINKYNEVNLEEQNIYKVLKTFIFSGNKHLIRL